jgi:hypothetical protein
LTCPGTNKNAGNSNYFIVKEIVMPTGVYVRTFENSKRPHLKENLSEETVRLMSEAQSGEKGHNYKSECHDYETRICDPICGCGETFECLRRSNQKYILGHNGRTKEAKRHLSETNSGEKNGQFGVEPWNKDTKGIVVAWNKNLTKETDLRVKKNSFQISSTLKEGYKSGRIVSARLGKPCPKGAGHSKGGIREDIGIYVRSTWEANFVRILDLLGISWLYESKRFALIRADGSKMTYCPDFYVYGVYWEVKGYMRPEAAEKIKLFKEQYPEQGLGVVDHEEYKKLEREYRDLIPNWES